MDSLNLLVKDLCKVISDHLEKPPQTFNDTEKYPFQVTFKLSKEDILGIDFCYPESSDLSPALVAKHFGQFLNLILTGKATTQTLTALNMWGLKNNKSDMVGVITEEIDSGDNTHGNDIVVKPEEIFKR